MKRALSTILSTLLAVLMTVSVFAGEVHPFGLITDKPEEGSYFELSMIIENYKAHGEDEIAEFRKELDEKEMLDDIIYPEKLSHVFAVSNHETLRYVKRGSDDVFGDEAVIMGIKKGNGFVTIANSEFRDGKGDFDGGLYGSDEGQFCRLYFTESAQKFLDSLSSKERENFMLNFWLSVMDTDEAVGLSCEKIYRNDAVGDINGDGMINAKDRNAFAGFLVGKSSGIIPQNCDLDGNGVINFRDNFCLKRIILTGSIR